MASRIRVLWRTIRGLGLRGTWKLMRVQMDAGSAEEGKLYEIPVPGLPHPVVIRGGKSSDATVLYQMFCIKEYEPATSIQSPAFILDAGANVGLASLYFLRRYPRARIFAVEPDPGNFRICQMNFAPYGDRVRLHLGAVWSHPCRLMLVPCPTEWGLAVRAAEPGEDGPIEGFDMETLLAIAGERNVDLLKLDIEGSEAEIFQGGTPEWLRGVRNITIEFHGDECERRFLEAMKEFEYHRIRRPMVDFFLDIHPR